MKYKIQLACSSIFILTIIKGFFKSLNTVDAIALLCVTSVFLVYEFINNTRTEEKLKILRKETNTKIEGLSKSLEDTKSYMSKFSTASAIVRR